MVEIRVHSNVSLFPTSKMISAHALPVWLLKEHSVLLVTSLLVTDLLKPEKANQLIFLANNLEYPYITCITRFTIPIYHLYLRTWNIEITFPNHLLYVSLYQFIAYFFPIFFVTCFLKTF